MKDQEFLMWLHERLEHVHREPAQADYMHKLRAIIEATPEDKETPNFVRREGKAMNEEKRCEIERLAAAAHDKRVRYENLGMMNTPSEPEAKKTAAVEYALARREMIEANMALEDALNA